MSEEYKSGFFLKYDFTHSSPQYPQSNGQAEIHSNDEKHHQEGFTS